MTATHYFHRITIPGRASFYSAWFAGDPRDTKSAAVLIDAERLDARRRSYPVTEAEWEALSAGPWTASRWGVFNGQPVA